MVQKGTEKFRKTARLRKRPEFLSLSRSGKKIHSADFIIISRRSLEKQTRLGVTVSGKVGNAVVRNRIKRLVREHFRRNRQRIAPPSDVLVIARPGAKACSFERVGKELDKALIWRERQTT